MDSDISRWILEFLLRKSLDDHTLNVLSHILPIPTNNPNFTKTILLRKILSQISTNSISEQTLSLLEQIEQLDHTQGHNSPESIKSAYCAVAVHCTVKFVDDKNKYFDAVKRIWKLRVGKMEGGLVSDELMRWRDEIENSVWDESACRSLVVSSEGIDAVGLVRVYVEQELVSMGSSFLEFSAEALSGKLGLRNNWMDECHRPDPCVSNGPDVVISTSNKEMPKGNLLPRRKHVANRYYRKAICGTSRGAKIADTEKFGNETSDNIDMNISPETDKVKEALESSILELRNAVKDPLPDALRLSDTIISNMAKENRDNDPAVANQNRVDVDGPSSSVDRRIDAVQANEGNTGNWVRSHQNYRTKASLMERNSTACFFEWDDSIDNLPEGSLNGGPSRPHLPSPKKIAVSPLKKYEITKLTRRRKFRKWSTLEEDTLRAGVQKYGVGNWKLILSIHPDIFEERTEVDLKDKWRNMIRSN